MKLGIDIHRSPTGFGRGWWSWSRRASPLETIHRKVSVYRTFVKYARRQGIMTNNPAESVVLPKVEKRMPEVVPEHAMNQLFSEEVFCDGLERSPRSQHDGLAL